ncbi:hypothetical protein MKW98_023767 [Papaver atlanticum]|uniref:Uncharacterized protein n=1 Tax=Papaver atlanticum TaxID=357466 RepID=A0AAD4SYX9_9MAGN|nr:hypothetical protein MKW98_023767 [Papaver atlanticum]
MSLFTESGVYDALYFSLQGYGSVLRVQFKVVLQYTFNQHWISKLITAEIDRGVVKDNKKKETHTLKRLNFSGSRKRGEMGSDGKEGTYISNRLPV